MASPAAPLLAVRGVEKAGPAVVCIMARGVGRTVRKGGLWLVIVETQNQVLERRLGSGRSTGAVVATAAVQTKSNVAAAVMVSDDGGVPALVVPTRASDRHLHPYPTRALSEVS